jgi:FAD/FMN-containing dehydrogenase
MAASRAVTGSWPGSAPGSGVQDRRAFLLRAGAAAGSAAIAASFFPAAGAGASVRAAGRWRPGARPPTDADWQALRRELSTAHLVRPGQAGYGQARELYDPRFDSLAPHGIAYCGAAADVSACLSFARRFALPVRARCGGHSYAGWSSVTGGLVVDVSPLNSFSVGSGTVRVGAGLALIDFYQRLAARGLAVPGGTCATVGIAGLALGGGVGVLSRLYGLTCDNLESLRIVTADGSVLTADAARHSDLYWACRGGGGGNFGVATSFTFRTRPLRHLVLFNLSWPWAQAARVVGGWQSWAPAAPDPLWSAMHLSARPGGSPRIGVSGAYVGTVTAATSLLDQLYAAVGSGPATASVRQETYLDAMLANAGCTGLLVPQCHTRPGGKLPRVPSYAKSDFFSAELSAAAIGVLLTGVEKMAAVRGAAGGLGEIGFDAFGGALNRVPKDATAFVHRNALFDAQYRTLWTSPGTPQGIANQHAWLRSFYAALHPHANGEAYQNYVDPDLASWRQSYYGTNYPRLSAVKARYDPHMLFRFPQAISPPKRA